MYDKSTKELMVMKHNEINCEDYLHASNQFIEKGAESFNGQPVVRPEFRVS
jgi:hypothetical protein